VGITASEDRKPTYNEVPVEISAAAESGGAFAERGLSATLAAVTSAFGDPTRRNMYTFARENPGGVTAAEVSERFSVHPNVARHHLDKLAAGGYLEVSACRAPNGGAGRPSKRYRVTDRGTDLPSRRRGDDLLVALLAEALSRLALDEATVLAERVGENYGKRLASQMDPGAARRSFRSALHAIAGALTAHGFEAHVEARGGSLALIKDSCPFLDTAVPNPVMCAVDRGMVRGMLSSLYGDKEVSSESSRAMGDDACVSIV
jgi:predicted ArsR family transcriptional regulator